MIKFYMHIHRLVVEIHEDLLMKIFMVTLGEKARFWYEKFPSASLCSLKDLYVAFCKTYKQN